MESDSPSAKALGEDGATVILVSTTARIHDRAAELEQDGISAAGLPLTSRNMMRYEKLWMRSRSDMEDWISVSIMPA